MKIVTVIAVLILLGTSCKKEKSDPSPQPPSTPNKDPDYFPLATGNYWIYEVQRVEMDGTTTSLNKTDSAYISKDTVIKGNTYFKYHHFDHTFGRMFVDFLRSSANQLMDANGKTISWNGDTTQVLFTYTEIQVADTVYKITEKMANVHALRATPAGVFPTITIRQTIQMWPGTQPQGNPNPRIVDRVYAKDVGIISETQPPYAALSYHDERKLLRFKVKQ